MLEFVRPVTKKDMRDDRVLPEVYTRYSSVLTDSGTDKGTLGQPDGTCTVFL